MRIYIKVHVILSCNKQFLKLYKGRTYKYYQGKPLWPFGYGLSYTQFKFDWNGTAAPQYTISNLNSKPVTYTVNVTSIHFVFSVYSMRIFLFIFYIPLFCYDFNTGNVAGEVIQVFVKPANDSLPFSFTS
jgi:hypothetical protein